jgi:predicted ABC-type ATPase
MTFQQATAPRCRLFFFALKLPKIRLCVKNLTRKLQIFTEKHYICNKINIYTKLKNKDMAEPRLYIIAGCNGAGKTTASFSVLPQILQCPEFVNADEIARGLSPFHPEDVAVEAGRLMLRRIDYLLTKHSTFAIETTLATRSYQRLVERAQQQGYKVILLFFWLESPQMAERRVAKRVSEGGHDIPKDVIHRRYRLGLNNLFNIYMPIVDVWRIYDNNDELKLIADVDKIVDSNKFKFRKFNLLISNCKI